MMGPRAAGPMSSSWSARDLPAPPQPTLQADSFRPFADRDMQPTQADSFLPSRTASWRRESMPFYAGNSQFVAEAATDMPSPHTPLSRKLPSATPLASHSARASVALPRLPSITVSSGDQPRTMNSFNPLTTRYTPTFCLNKGRFRCPLYYNLLEPPPGNRFSIGNNSEYTEFILAFCHDEFARELLQQGVQVDGYYMNDHGFFMVTQQAGNQVDLDAVITHIVDTSLKGLLKTQKLRIPLDDALFLQYLLYVAEGFQG